MHLAAGNGHLHIVKFLIDNNYDVNPIDRWGASPLNDATNDSIIAMLE
jgi:ankyrin repeat protein